MGIILTEKSLAKPWSPPWLTQSSKSPVSGLHHAARKLTTCCAVLRYQLEPTATSVEPPAASSTSTISCRAASQSKSTPTVSQTSDHPTSSTTWSTVRPSVWSVLDRVTSTKLWSSSQLSPPKL